MTIGGKEYQLNDTHFPTVNPDNPLELTKEEVTKGLENLAFVQNWQ